jgi:hypothetical protein
MHLKAILVKKWGNSRKRMWLLRFTFSSDFREMLDKSDDWDRAGAMQMRLHKVSYRF